MARREPPEQFRRAAKEAVMIRRLAVFLILGAAIAAGRTAAATPWMGGSRPLGRAPEGGSKPNCQTALANRSFDCHVKGSFGDDFTDCFQFFSPGSASLDFDLVVLGLDPSHLGCTCGATGSLKKPKFDTSKNIFACESGFGIQFGGKVGGSGNKTKITKGFASTLFGDSYVFECTSSSKPCGASPSGAFVDGQVTY
jgi:hypothetical protein